MRTTCYRSLITTASLFIVIGGIYSTASSVRCSGSPHAAGLHATHAKPSQTLFITGDWELSPTDKQVAIQVTERVSSGSNRRDLCIVELDSKNSPRTIAEGGGCPAWSPDERLVAYSQTTKRLLWNNIAAENIAIYSCSNGSTSKSDNGYVDSYSSWQPRGSKLAFARNDFARAEDGRLAGWIMVKPSEGKPKRVGPTYLAVDRPRWRPSSSSGEIAFAGSIKATGPLDLPRRTDLYLLSTITGKSRKLTDSGDINRFSVDWSPNGRYLAYITGVGEFRALEVFDLATNSRHAIMGPMGIGRSKIGRVGSIRWSPNGDAIAFDVWEHASAGPTNVVCLKWRQSRPIMITRDGRSKAPRWSSDGKRILYVRDQNSIWAVHPDGSQSTRLYTITKPNGSGSVLGRGKSSNAR